MKKHGTGCDGACNPNPATGDSVECIGNVRRVHVTHGSKDWGVFDYCEVAIETDTLNGMTVKEVAG